MAPSRSLPWAKPGLRVTAGAARRRRPLFRLAEPDPLHAPGLRARVEDPQGDDAAGLLALQRLPEIRLGPDRLSLDRQDDVRAAALRVVEQHFPGRASRRHIGDD